MAGDSNNPFRRKGPSFVTPPAISVPNFPGAYTSSIGAGGASERGHYFDQALEPASSVQTPSSGSELFKQQLQSLPKSAQAPPSTTFQKPKPVKKVRVQSPPPSSPESAHDADFDARFPPDPDYSAGFALHHPPRSDSESDGSEVTADDDPFVGDGSSVPPTQRTSDEEIGISGRHAGGLAERESWDPHSVEQQQQATSTSSGRTPNPFQRTLGDLEQPYKDGTASGAAAVSPAGKAPLDVDAFRRLLMTGQSGAAANPHGHHSHQQHANSAQPLQVHHQTDAASITDTSSISRQSISDERSSSGNPATETPRTSHEISEPEGEEEQHSLISSYAMQPPRTTLRKKPPPPASRHGKLIKVELGKDNPNGVAQPRQDDAGLVSPTGSSTDLNKPLPPAPRQQAGDPRESVFDREAAGKIPEVDVDPDAPEEDIPAPRPPTPPNVSHSTTAPVPASQPQLQESLVSRFSTSAARKPAPPPRRQAHGRSDSRATITSNASLSSPTMPTHPPYSPMGGNQMDGADQGYERKVSSDSIRSRSSGMRTPGAAPPAPPPPRRPNSISAPPRLSSHGPGPSPSPGGLPDTPSPGAGPDIGLASGHEDERSLKPPITPPTTGTTVKNSNTPSPSNSIRRPTAVPPPLPPARQRSMRNGGGRPASIKSVDLSRRLESRESGPTPAAGPPPPPPRPRVRGGSRTDGSTADSSKRNSNSGVAGVGEGEFTPGGAENILADLDALRREVDALRGQIP
ncbi:hypothetical protein RB595_007842 [Gaeumannomyces hyphopodioides]